MRIRIEFTSENDIIVPIHYNFVLQGFIYKNIFPPILADELHNAGFKSKSNREYKLFVFSKIYSSNKKMVIDKRNKNINFGKQIYIFISSPFEDMSQLILTQIKSLSNLSNPLELNANKIDIFKYDSENFVINKSTKKELLFRPLSPITIYSTLKNEFGNSKTYYYNPHEIEFSQMMFENAKRKFEAYFSQLSDEDKKNISLDTIFAKDFVIIPKYFDNKKNMHIIYYKDKVVKAYSGIFTLKADGVLIDFILKAGLGSRNSLGFGMIEEYHK